MTYKHEKIEKFWQQEWDKKEAFKADLNQSKQKYYALAMFPYPSGSGLHVGHMACYTPIDIISRFKRAQGFNVLNPIGYDAFGLPAEQYAISTGIHPSITTNKAIQVFREQLKNFGFSFDWSRELSTCEPTYYKWTQFLFTKLYDKGLAYQKEVPVNWCPALKTVLANEEVIDGKSERGDHPVIRIPMKQWMLKITDYAERLLNDLDKVDWPERTKEGQRNWIGKSEGTDLQFEIENHAHTPVKVFTTRPDTLFGVSFLVLAPEHPLISKITDTNQKKDVDNYVETTSRKSEVDRKSSLDKTGIFTGAYAIHPFSKKRLPIWIADYVLLDYGTGAIMGVPGHDERDYEFAKKYNLEIIRVIQGGDLPYLGDGVHVESRLINGLKNKEAIEKMNREIEAQALGTPQIQFKLRDWLFSRQRYWGEPFPLIHLPDGSLKTVPLNELPVLLPEVADYEPTENGEAPLARAKDWVRCKQNGKDSGFRECDTMPGSAGSSWYFLRYTDPHNSQEAFSFESQKYWMPVDFYLGGAEHTVGHLLYARFWQKVLFDVGLVSHDEPFQKLYHQGLILGPDGEKMSKSRGNVINPDEVREIYGTDAIRLYICFLGPTDKDKPWSTKGIDGVHRFLERIWRLIFNEQDQVIASDQAAMSSSLEKLLHKTIKKVTEDIESLSFNTAISSMMILVNEMYKENVRSRSALRILSQLLMPFAPHMAEEFWMALGGQGLVSLSEWPQYRSDLIVDETITMAVQVSGKTRGTIQISPQASEKEALNEALKISTVSAAMGGKEISKVIYKAGKILNLILKN